MSNHRWIYKGVRAPARFAGGDLVADVELTIDLDRLVARLARSAIKSKGKKSQLASGLIKVKVIGDVRHEGGAA